MAVETMLVNELSTSWYLRSQRQRLLLLAAATVAVCIIAAGLALLLDFVAAAVFLVVALLIGIFRQPRVGLYALFGLVLLFENVSPDPLMRPGYFLAVQLDRLVSPNSASTSGGVLINPYEVVLFLILTVWAAQGIARRRLEFRGGRLWWPMMLFLLALIGGLVHGAAVGDFHVGLWEARALFYLVFCYVLASNTVRTHRQVAIFTGLLLICNTLFALDGAFRHLVLDIKGDEAYEHVDVIFLGSVLIQTLVQNVFGGPRWQRILGLLASPIAVYTLLASERRAGYIAIVIAVVACIAVLMVAHRKAFYIIAGTLLVVSAIYLPVFWNNGGLLGQPARAVRSMYQPDPRDAASNLYRDIEKVDVVAGIAESPLLGLGFGVQFPFVAPLPDLSFWLFWHYEPHHNVLWVWLKVGAIGFVIFWILMGSAIARGAHFAVKLREPNARAFALLTLACVVMTLVFCYVDLGLVSGRVTIFLGTLLGILGVLDRLPTDDPTSSMLPKAGA